ncbi:MAG: 16S rRNA (cytidine(1402)-2'-O)-methyltransferase [Actinomycetota bacterium]|nr:16S rRNA (cytidine(1402)-2'-O)-methyltransferase [Actinomycetota bacterium]
MVKSGTAGRVILAGVPLGQVGDASARLSAALASAPVIAAEDTRRLRRLCADLGVTPTGRVVSFFEANEAARIPGLLDTLREGADVLVVTDAGMPSVSDPGYRLVAAAVAAGIEVTALPGPSAVTTALVVSGLPVDRFCFEGFLPRKAGERRRALAALAAEPRTMVFFEAPHRLAAALGDLVDAFGAARPAAICRELTKTYEEVRRGGLAELAEWAAGDVRGEITLVIAGAGPAAASQADPGTLAREVAVRESAGQARKDAIAAVAAAHATPKRTVFDAVVAGKGHAASAREIPRAGERGNRGTPGG